MKIKQRVGRRAGKVSVQKLTKSLVKSAIACRGAGALVQGLLASKSPCTQVPRLKTPLLEAFNILQIKIEFSFSLKPHCAVKGTGHFKII